MSLSISNVFTHTSILIFCWVLLFFFIFQNSHFLHSAFCTFGTPHSAFHTHAHSRFPLTVLFTYSVSVDSIKYPLLMCRFEEKTGVRTTECGMRSEWCITRDLCLEWGISFLLEISAYIKINVKKDQNKDVSTVRRSFSRWELKKIACFLLLSLKMTVKRSKCLYSIFNVNFYIEIRFEKFVEISGCDSRWEFSATISPIMRGLKTLIHVLILRTFDH